MLLAVLEKRGGFRLGLQDVFLNMAGGIKVALLTTVAGLIVGVILQVFYNYLVSKIDSLVNTMEDSSISFVDLLVHYNQTKK